MIVRQAANVLDLLEYFAESQKPANLADVSAALGWPRSSTFNLLTTLAQRGYLYEPHPRGGYYPSPRWNAVLHSIGESEVLPESLFDAADEVAKTTGETVAIAAPAGTNAVFVHVVESASVVRYSAKVGYQVPIHLTASGRALLAQYAPRELAAVLKRVKFEKIGARSVTSAEQVMGEITKSVSRGWHEVIDTHTTGLTGVAVPVGLPDRRLSIVVGGPTDRTRPQIPQIAAALKRALKRHLGSRKTHQD
jgi:IclR family transcriptional regulator, acetate operon repressor